MDRTLSYRRPRVSFRACPRSTGRRHRRPHQAVQLQEPEPGAAAREDRHQHGSGRRRRQPEDHRHGRRGAQGDQRAEAGRDTRAKKAIANFKLRAGIPIGAMVTLRRARMWEFLDRLVSVALPRMRDFKGISRKAFDGKGNYTLGLKEQIIFPEIDYDKIDAIKGLNISFVTTAKTDEEGRALLQQLGMPFRAA
jgi:hypothetical protein